MGTSDLWYSVSKEGYFVGKEKIVDNHQKHLFDSVLGTLLRSQNIGNYYKIYSQFPSELSSEIVL